MRWTDELLQQRGRVAVQRRVDPRIYGKWECPRCRAVHHFDSITGCHRDGCPYRGILRRIA